MSHVQAYVAARGDFARATALAENVSRGSGGLESATPQHYWASILFTRLVVTAKSVQALTPEPRPRAHCDFSAVASIIRNLAECYLFYFFLCVDDVPQDEKEARIILLNLHDDGSRGKLFGELDGAEPDEETQRLRQIVRDDLEARFNANTFLAALPEKRKRELLRGEKTPFVQDEVIDRTDLDRKQFRFLYRFLSSHTHSGPIAFYRMTDHGRGMGFFNEKDAFYMAAALDFGGGLLARATREMLALFPLAEERGRKLRSAEIRRPKSRSSRARRA